MPGRQADRFIGFGGQAIANSIPQPIARHVIQRHRVGRGPLPPEERYPVIIEIPESGGDVNRCHPNRREICLSESVLQRIRLAERKSNAFIKFARLIV
jgi:hypothetical protein